MLKKDEIYQCTYFSPYEVHCYKSPCGDCASAKQCHAFSKKEILKAYKKQCKLDQKKEA